MLPHGGRFDASAMRPLDAIFRKLAKRHLISERDSVVDLTFRLRTNPEEVTEQAAQACDPKADRATRQRNSRFLRNLSDARKAPLAYRPLKLPSLALLTFRRYYQEHGHIPRRDELKKLTERVRRKPISAREWRRVLRDDGLEELFAPVKGSE
jgi:hypothetical protein